MIDRVIQLIVLMVAVSVGIGQETKQDVFRVSGVVQSPDGKPDARATVKGITDCNGEPSHLVQTAKTALDGSFSLQFLGSECRRIQLSASNVEEFWLQTGLDVFYAKENGTAPIVDVPASGPPAPVLIRLEERGGLVDFRVWDAAAGRFIRAFVDLERSPVLGSKFGSMEFATGQDGSADTLFLPMGEYEFSVVIYDCHGTDYLAANRPHGTLRIEAGQRVAKDFSVDVRQIKPQKSQNNPHGEPCEPKIQRSN